MIEKGKGRFVENLHTIQLCEADLNFTLHTIWGHRPIKQALCHSALDSSQFSILGQTCNNAVLNKVLFFDLSRQTLSPGILMDYDATAAFDRVLANLSIVTSQQMSLPRNAGYFTFHLLQRMSFNLITGFGKSNSSYNNDSHGVAGQGVLQGSSSAAPLFILNSDVSLHTYKKLSTGATFSHPISKETICDKAVQYVDNTSQFLNAAGMGCHTTNIDLPNLSNLLHKHASQNSKLWSDSVWMSGGNLNSSKCFMYAFFPKIKYKTNKINYLSLPLPSPIRLHNPENKSSHPILHVSPNIAK